jgi:DNA-binding NarL/FixJ family response regulator
MTTHPQLSQPLHILLVDDHAIVREGLARILQASSRLWQVSQAADGREALQLLRDHPADVVVADISMPGMNGLELIRRLRARDQRLGILMLSMHAEEQYAVRAFRCGANGYLTKERAGAELIEAVCKVASGGLHVTASLAERVVLGLQGRGEVLAHQQLSDRELDVMRRLVAGQRVSSIAQDLNLSVKTVSTHKRRLMDKLALPNTAALIRFGMESGLVPDLPLADLESD